LIIMDKYDVYWSKLSTSINNKSKSGKCRIFPNPATTFLTIETGISGLYDIRITSLNGQLLYSTKMERPTLQIDLSSFQKGVYFITVRSGDQVWTEKIIKL